MVRKGSPVRVRRRALETTPLRRLSFVCGCGWTRCWQGLVGRTWGRIGGRGPAILPGWNGPLRLSGLRPSRPRGRHRPRDGLQGLCLRQRVRGLPAASSPRRSSSTWKASRTASAGTRHSGCSRRRVREPHSLVAPIAPRRFAARGFNTLRSSTPSSTTKAPGGKPVTNAVHLEHRQADYERWLPRAGGSNQLSVRRAPSIQAPMGRAARSRIDAEGRRRQS
jgi:hypothetical protein